MITSNSARFLLVSIGCLISSSAFSLTGFVLEDTLVHPSGGSWFGASAAVGGDTAMLGNNSFPETVHVFDRDVSGVWAHTQTIANGTNPAGIHVRGLDGDTALMWGLVPGATAKDRWFVYARESGTWTFATELVAPVGVMLGSGDSSVGRAALDGDRVVIPASQATKANPVSMLVVYDRPAAGWNAGATLAPSTTVNLGNAAGDILRLAGLAGDSVAFFTRPASTLGPVTLSIWDGTGGVWTQAATLTPIDPTLVAGSFQDYLDADAAMMTLVAPSGSADTRQVQVFNKPAGGWANANADAVLTVGSDGIVGRGIDGTTVLGAGVAGTPNENTLYVYSATAGAWSSTDPATEQLVPPGSFAQPVLSGNTILAPPYIYRAPQPTGGGNEADIATTKISDLDTPGLHPGQQVVFTITTRNLFGVTANVRVQDRLPIPLTYVSHVATTGSYDPTNGMWNVGPLAANAPTETLTIFTLVEDLPPNKDPCIDNTARTFITDLDIFDSDASNNSPTLEMSFGDTGCSDFFVGNVTVRPIDDDSFWWTLPLFTDGPGLGEGRIWFAFDLPPGLDFTDAGVSEDDYPFTTVTSCEETMLGNGRTIVSCEVEIGGNFGCPPGTSECRIDISADLDPDTFSGGTVTGSACSLAVYDPRLRNNRTGARAPQLSMECPGKR